MLKAIEAIPAALLTVTDKVYHYEAAHGEKNNYIVWAEDSTPKSVWADNKCTHQVIEGTIDYYTGDEDDPNVEKIPAALNDGEIFWRLGSIQYERDTKYIHYEWIWEVIDVCAAK